jgi:hypothetical protein
MEEVMKESKYAKYVTQKPAINLGIAADGKVKFGVPDSDKLPMTSQFNTGPRLIFSNDMIKEATSKIEYGFIMADTTLLTDKGNYGAHKHDYAEIFLFLGNDPHDTTYLGAEGEFWLGEGDDLEKVTFNKSCSVYVPPGVGHFPLFLKNVKSPVMMGVVVPNVGDFQLVSVSRH